MSNREITGAFVLAAGLGKRMRHLRDNCPKPLMPIAGRSLLDRVLDRVEEAGLTNAIVNIHYQADKMKAHLEARAEGPTISLSDESGALLETGGGIKKALDLIPSDPFFAINSDALWMDNAVENTLTAMKAAWDATKMDVLMVMVPRLDAFYFNGAGDFFMDDNGQLIRRGDADTAPFVFGGIQIINKNAFKGIAENKFSLNKIYDSALQEGRAYGHYFKGTWMHIGDPEALAAAEQYFATLK